MSERFDTVVIGGGQAGLAMGYHLSRLHRPFVILDENARTGDGWRTRWEPVGTPGGSSLVGRLWLGSDRA